VAVGLTLASVLGSMYHPVTVLDVYGVLAADGESSARVDSDRKMGGQVGGPGGGSGGSLLLFLQTMILGNGSLLSTAGGQGGAVGGGGGAGGRVHFHWSDIPTGEDYVPIATVEGHIDTRLFTNQLFGFLKLALMFEKSCLESSVYKVREDLCRKCNHLLTI
jgi:hypothetical protein